MDFKILKTSHVVDLRNEDDIGRSLEPADRSSIEASYITSSRPRKKMGVVIGALVAGTPGLSSTMSFDTIIAAICSDDYLLVRFQAQQQPPFLRIVALPQTQSKRVVALALSPTCDLIACVTMNCTVFLISVAALLRANPNSPSEVVSLGEMFDAAQSPSPTIESIVEFRPPSDAPVMTPTGCTWWATLDARAFLVVCSLEGTLLFVNLHNACRNAVNVQLKLKALEVIPENSGAPCNWLLIHSLNGGAHLMLLEKLGSVTKYMYKPEYVASSQMFPVGTKGRRPARRRTHRVWTSPARSSLSPGPMAPASRASRGVGMCLWV